MKNWNQFIFSFILFFLVCSVTTVDSTPIMTIDDVQSSSQGIEKSKSELKMEAKIERKSKRLKRKIGKIATQPEKFNKGKILLIVGSIMLLIGILILVSVSGASTIGGCLGALFGLVFGVAIGVGGIVTIINGLVHTL